MSDAPRPVAWRTAALFGDSAACDWAVLALRVERSRRAWIGEPEETPALRLFGADAMACEGAPWGWVVLARSAHEGPPRGFGSLLASMAVDVACAIHSTNAPWTEAHARWWADVRDAGVGAKFVILDGPDEAAAEAERALRVTLCALGLPGDDVGFVACDFEALSEEWDLAEAGGGPSLTALLAAWDAAPVAHPPRDEPTTAPGRQLHCAACGRPVTAPVVVVTPVEHEREQRLDPYAQWFVAPGFCLAEHPEAWRRDCWHVEVCPLVSPVLQCPCGRRVGERWRPRLSDQGGADPDTWTVAALDKAAVRFE